MSEVLSEYMELLKARYAKHCKETNDWPLFITTALGPRQVGLEEDMLAFLKDNPDATWKEVNQYFSQFLTILEIVDDDELGEDDE